MTDSEYIGRKLLFHRNGVDDSIGTYVTDYLITVLCLVMSSIMTYIIRRHKQIDDKRIRTLCGYGYASAIRYCLPWNWPRPLMTSVTMTTYATLLFVTSYGVMTVLGGLPHQFLQQVEPYNSWEDSWTWLIIWRLGAGMSVPVMFAMFTLMEQICSEEKFLPLSRPARKIYYGINLLFCTSVAIWNLMRWTDDTNPYDVTTLYLAFMGSVLVYSIWMTVVVIRSAVLSCREREDQKSKQEKDLLSEETQNKRKFATMKYYDVRWDLLLHWICPCLIIAGGAFSYILTPYCSKADDPHEVHDCPLPNDFNHNATMHIIHMVAIVCLTLGEIMAIRRRKSLWSNENPISLNNNENDSSCREQMVV